MEIDDMVTYVLPDELDGLPMFPVGDLNAPIIFPSALNAMLYVMDFFPVTCEQAARSVSPVKDTFSLEPFDYAAIPMPSLMTCPRCGAAITEKTAGLYCRLRGLRPHGSDLKEELPSGKRLRAAGSVKEKQRDLMIQTNSRSGPEGEWNRES